MKAKWKEMGECDSLPYLLVESGPSIRELFVRNQEAIKPKGMLIVSVDSPSLLTQKEKEIFCDQLNRLNIHFGSVGNFIWIDKEQIGSLFEQTDFGESGDTCFLFSKKPQDFELGNIPRIKGILKRRFPTELLDAFKKYGPSCLYFTNMIPDLLIACDDKRLLENIDSQIDIA